MATLESIGVTLGVGLVVTAAATAAFGFAVRSQSPLVAPRASARPPQVVHDPRPSHPSQDRGSAWLGWVPWTLGLSYEVMLRGVPGTGTRDGGMSGLMLKVNLDGIVMLRFHALCRRVSLAAALLFNVVLLPVYYTARCFDPDDGNDATGECSAAGGYNLTSYERLTIRNVPDALSGNSTRPITSDERQRYVARLYAASFVYLAVVLYALYLLDRAFVLLLALRRVYYLEHDLWQERRNELRQTLLWGSDGKARDQKGGNNRGRFDFDQGRQHHQQQRRDKRDKNGDGTGNGGGGVDNPRLFRRDPWIPHPEQRETVPNVSLYSVVVGGLPSIPETLLREAALGSKADGGNDDGGGDDPLAGARRTNVDWQLDMATQIFDLCVPNQPGYSSSVVAVTILPPSREMTPAWRRWYAAASKMRRLAYIREEIGRRRGYEIEVEDDDSDEDGNDDAGKGEERRQRPDDPSEEYFSASQLHPSDGVVGGTPALTVAAASSPAGVGDNKDTPRPIYRGLSRRKSYYRQVFGSTVQEELEKEVAEAIALGPEQAAVYSRELAQSAAACCPFGCREDRVRDARIDDLVEMEREAAEELHAANEALNEIRRKVTMAADEPRSSHGNKSALSFDEGMVPSDLDLEAQLYSRMASNHKPPQSLHSSGATSSPAHDVASPARRAMHRQSSSANLWQHVEAIVNDAGNEASRLRSRSLEVETSERSSVETGEWHVPTVRTLRHQSSRIFAQVRDWALRRSTVAVDSIARESTVAVVTFTSRQAAVAARACVADGRGQERWQTLREIPVPPLADAAACDVMACRNCCRPVTVSINNRQKSARKYIAICLLAAIYVFYTVPLTFVASLPTATGLTQLSPELAAWLDSMGLNITGILSSVLYSLFFSVCPTMFKAIANFGSGSTSVAQAEHIALQYYWYFMVITAFSSTMIANMVIEGFNSGLTFGSGFRDVVGQISGSVVQISVTWFNWIIYRFTVTLPLNYLLQVNTYIFSFLGWKCCSRMMRGGGPGPPVPYRLYVDSGVVLMCILALAPAVPLLSLAGLAYFITIEPLLRRNLIFVYRPKFDNGGARWDVLFVMVIVSMAVGSILLTAQMILKGSLGPTIIAALSIVPPIMYQFHASSKYKRSFDDAALLQTSLLDGWDTTQPTSMEQREEFRRWLVDAHKAAFVPVCLFGMDTVGCLTAEPAVVIPMDSDLSPQNGDAPADEVDKIQVDRAAPSPKSPVASNQIGATFRRSVHAVALLRKTTGTLASDNVSLLTEDRLCLSLPTTGNKKD